MKRLFLLFTVCVFFSNIVYAYTCKIDGICYNLNKTNYTATVTYSGYPYNNDYTGHYGGDGLKDKDIVIPSTISYEDVEYTVTAIDDYAFWDAESTVKMSSVTIPSTVTSIGKQAFQRCINLTSLIIPSSVNTIGDGAFSGCTSLTSLTIEEGVASIGSSAFYNCAGLTSVIIPGSVTVIENYAFEACSNLNSVTIGNGVSNIGIAPFGYCTSLTSISVDETNSVYDSRNACNAIIETSTNVLIQGCKTTVIPNGVTSIGEHAFSGISSLNSITIPNSVSRIGARAFSDTGWYKSQPKGFLYIDNWLIGYKGDKPTGEIIIIEGTRGIADRAFEGCCNLTQISIPHSVVGIGMLAFSGCGMASVTIPGSVSYMGFRVFYACENLTSVILQDGVTTIGNSAFDSASSLTSISIPESVTSIESNAFERCSSLSSITIPKGVNEIGDYAFRWCTSIFSIIIPNSVTSLGHGTFQSCSNLSSIVIPNSVNTIGNWTFSGCSSLSSVIIPNSVANLGDGTFNGCSHLSSVIIPNSVTTIGYSTFGDCSNLTSVTVNSHTPLSITKSAFSNRTNATLYVPAGSKAAYEAADYWKEFKEIVELSTITVVDQTACRGGQVQLPVGMNNLEQIVGFQFDLQLPEGITVATDGNGNYATSLTGRKDDHSLSVSKVGDNQYRFVSVSMNNKPFSGNDGPLVNVKLKVDESVTAGSHTIKVTDAELTTIGKEAINAANAVAMLTVKDAELGDVNGDMTISVTDVVAIISHILNDTPASFIESAADVNNDGRITVTDAVGVIDMILNKQ